MITLLFLALGVGALAFCVWYWIDQRTRRPSERDRDRLDRFIEDNR